MKHNKKSAQPKVGSTGSGMSFYRNKILAKFFVEARNNYGVIIDVGESYRKMCETLRAKKP